MYPGMQSSKFGKWYWISSKEDLDRFLRSKDAEEIKDLEIQPKKKRDKR